MRDSGTEFLFIITYGRSGSTLLQGVLNSLNNCRIYGENFNYLFHIYQSYQALLKARAKESHHAPTHPWYGASLFSANEYLASCRELALSGMFSGKPPREDGIIYGFKEIRYIDILPDLEDYLFFLKSMFPTSLFVFNFRNHSDVMASEWWRDIPQSTAKEQLESFESIAFSFLQKNPQDSFLIRYEDVISKNENLKNLIEKTGSAFNPQTIDAVLATKHSYHSKKYATHK